MAEPIRVGSPFDFAKQMKLFIVQKMPDPRAAEYEEALADWISHFVEETDGRAFVLFTSYRGMQQVASRMANFFSRTKMNLLVQGSGAPLRLAAVATRFSRAVRLGKTWRPSGTSPMPSFAT